MVALGAVVTDNTPAVPAPYGLLSPAATVVNDDSPHWTGGFSYETLDCVSDVTLVDICNTADVSVEGVEGTGSELFRTYHPFAVQTSFKCSTMSRLPAEVEQIARDRIGACVQKAVEHEFWSGALAKEAAASYDGDGEYPNRFLASTGADDVTPVAGTAVKPKYGLALLEGALARCGCGIQGTIHTTREIASALAPKSEDGMLKTPLGNTIIAGPGYDGTGPNGQMPSGAQVWMYATGPVTVRLGPVETVLDSASQAVNIKNNETTYLVEQVAAVTWNSCCHYAVLVDLSLDYA